ncbi:MAG TPA: hypothetical protein VF101_01810 [Gaiellaceae bacterium]
MIKRYAAVAAVVLALAATVTGVLRATARRTGGPPAVQAFLDAKLRQLPQLNSANLGAPKPDYPGTQYLYIAATARDIPGAVKAEWEAGLLAAALADSGLTTVDGFLVTASDPNGKVLDENGTDVAPASLVPTMISTEAALGKKFPGAQFLHVGRLEAVIHARTPDAAAFAADYPHGLASVVGDDQGYDGRFVRVDDQAGKAVVVQGSVNRLNWRVTWVDPALGGSTAVSPEK